MAEGARELSGLPFRRTLVPFMMVESSKGPTSKCHYTEGLEFQYMNWGGHKHSDHNTQVLFPWNQFMESYGGKRFILTALYEYPTKLEQASDLWSFA